jgi:hypothetical protein
VTLLHATALAVLAVVAVAAFPDTLMLYVPALILLL